MKLLLFFLSLLLLLPIAINAESVAQPFDKVVPGRVFSFPQDHNLHQGFQSEWWYVTANLQGEDGLDYGAQFTLFSNTVMIGDQPQRIFFAHAALSTPTQFYHAERYAKAIMQHGGTQTKPWQGFIDHWQFNGSDDAPLPGNLNVSEPAFAYDLQLSASPYFLQGERGFSKKNNSGSLASYYYNAPFIKIDGTVYLKDKAIKVRGDGWLDREWSSGMFGGKNAGSPVEQNKKVSWDWLALHLDADTALMLYRVRSKDETYLSGMIMSASGKQTPLSAAQVNWQPTAHKMFDHNQYPISWQLKIPEHAIDINITPINDNQFINGTIPYWEGAIKVTGSHNSHGYLELFQ
ncbi:MAG: putative secreted hydrolase [Alteromonadaceae bacterium]|jgi:predicted secreted hydrolase